MNKKQKIVLWIGAIAFGLTLLYVPWNVARPNTQDMDILSGKRYSIPQSNYSMNGPIWDPPANSEMMVGVLFVEWAGIVAGAGILVFLLKEKPKVA